jgi:hypothetical protein
MNANEWPDVSGVYVLYGPKDECLYVGSSVNMRSRIATHQYRSLAARVECFPYSEDQLREREEGTIALLKPILNCATSIARKGQPSVTNTSKLSFAFTQDDVGLIEQLRAHLLPVLGKVSTIQVIRWALLTARNTTISTGGTNGHDEGVTSTKPTLTPTRIRVGSLSAHDE